MKTTHFPSLEGGMNTQKNPLALASSELQWVENLHWDNANGWSTDQVGFTQVNATALSGGSLVQSIYTFKDVTGLNRTLIQVGATLYHVTPLGGSVLGTLGATTFTPNTYVPFMGWCFILNANTSPKRWDGSTATFQAALGWPPVIAGVTVGNPAFGCVYANRLVLAGDSINPNTLYLSALEDPETFTPGALDDSAGAIQISPGDGQRITALMPLYVPYSNEHVLLVFKNASIYALRGYDSSSFRLELVSNTLGTETPRSLVAVGQDVWFISKSGINSLGPNTELGILSVGNISQPMQGRVSTVNQQELGKAFALHDELRRELWWCLPTGSSNVANEVWVQNYGSFPHKWSLKTGLSMSCGYTLPTGELLTGTTQGFWMQQRRGNSYNGLPIPWKLVTPVHSLGNLNALSRISMLDVYLKQVGNSGLTATATWELGADGTSDLPPSISLSSGLMNTYGIGLYGISQFMGQSKAIARLYPEGSGRLFELTLTGFTPEQPISITGYSMTTLEGGGTPL